MISIYESYYGYELVRFPFLQVKECTGEWCVRTPLLVQLYACQCATSGSGTLHRFSSVKPTYSIEDVTVRTLQE